tara:strand:+ start:69 stop:527 length:459 start_codon:yes stop_codon:yes gene_type:complete
VTKEFRITEDDKHAIQIANDVAQLFLSNYNLTPKQTVGLGHALYALERMPKVTEGIHCEFGIYYKYGNEDYNESKYYDFGIYEDRFEISIGGSTYDKSVGGDNYSEPGWVIEVGGLNKREAELYNLEDTIHELLNLGAEIKVCDESAIDLIE